MRIWVTVCSIRLDFIGIRQQKKKDFVNEIIKYSSSLSFFFGVSSRRNHNRIAPTRASPSRERSNITLQRLVLESGIKCKIDVDRSHRRERKTAYVYERREDRPRAAISLHANQSISPTMVDEKSRLSSGYVEYIRNANASLGR